MDTPATPELKLTRREQITLAAKYHEGRVRTNKELAERFGVKEPAISMRIARALAKLGRSPLATVQAYAGRLRRGGKRARVYPISLSLLTV
jgi:DNA-binding MarR family transcriptional regulator